MKIIKFKNGKYGVRKWSWINLGFVFAINHSGHWEPKNSNYVQEFDTKTEANKVLDGMLERRLRDRDCGSSIS